MSRKGTPKTVLRWARSAARDAGEGHELVLAVERIGAAPEPLRRWAPQEVDRDVAFGADVLEAAQDDADQRDGLISYQLQHRDAEGEVLSHMVIRRQGEDAEAVEGASLEGLVKQQMRHNEGLLRLHLQTQLQSAAFVERVLGLSEQLMGRISTMEEQFQKSLQLQAEHAQNEAEAGIAVMEAEAKLKLVDKVSRYVDLVAPQLLKRFSEDGAKKVGGEVAKQAAQKVTKLPVSGGGKQGPA